MKKTFSTTSSSFQLIYYLFQHIFQNFLHYRYSDTTFFQIQRTFDPLWVPTFERKNPQHENSILFAIGLDYDLFERDDGRRGMEDVKLRPVGTLACRCSAHARRPKRIFIGSHRDRLHAILAHAKRNFTPVTKWKLCASVFCINDSPPLDASSYFRFNRKRSERTTGDEFSFSDSFSARSSFFLQSFFSCEKNEWMGRENIRKFEKLFSNIKEVEV